MLPWIAEKTSPIVDSRPKIQCSVAGYQFLATGYGLSLIWTCEKVNSSQSGY